jgi:hypothetical protein
MARAVRAIPVKDKNGVRFTVFVREQAETIPILQRARKKFRYELETGEPGQFVDGDTFVLAESGELFRRIKRAKAVAQSADEDVSS